MISEATLQNSQIFLNFAPLHGKGRDGRFDKVHRVLVAVDLLKDEKVLDVLRPLLNIVIGHILKLNVTSLQRHDILENLAENYLKRDQF